MRCLIVEDDTSLAELVRLEIADQDVEGDCRHSIAAAIDALHEAPPDALIVDLTLPDGSGLDVAAEARRLCPRSPVLVFTGVQEADALAIFRSHANVRAIVAKRVEDGDGVGALARSMASMIRSPDGPEGARLTLGGLNVGRDAANADAAGPGLQRRATMAAALRKAAPGLRPGGIPFRSVRPEASLEDRPKPPRLRA